jgi:hypothetical protein
VAAFLGEDVKEILKESPDLIDLFTKGVPPVKANAQLYASAKGHGGDMMEKGYYNSISPDGSTPAMRIRATGYKPYWVAESLARVSTCNNLIAPEIMVPRIFKQMFLRAFQPGKFRDLNMFSEKAADAGISLTAGASVELGGICGDQVHVAVADYGAGKTGPDFALIGVVYLDANANGLFDSGEGVPGAGVAIKLAGEAGKGQTIYTHSAGGFFRQLTPGRYRVAIDFEFGSMVKWVDVSEANVWLPVALSATQ